MSDRTLIDKEHEPGSRTKAMAEFSGTWSWVELRWLDCLLLKIKVPRTSKTSRPTRRILRNTASRTSNLATKSPSSFPNPINPAQNDSSSLETGLDKLDPMATVDRDDHVAYTVCATVPVHLSAVRYSLGLEVTPHVHVTGGHACHLQRFRPAPVPA